ncbi:branched-chain amino acid ABC transporter substrate-binding protein [Rhodoferax sp.]|uniref:branched-chain amino acid ABC transporter substrate-binding protein n=1 Tax=Rhodoferax sp. TaxID=50421 RepID=UPI0026273777|nr:branched-chain amino acid ABC transporter substrate-binding protein [Rhodoferax sp.]MDD2926213.1 branched-chain amino acid ABC transporter substrate-binding protein [Rhodoferax sp.]
MQTKIRKLTAAIAIGSAGMLGVGVVAAQTVKIGYIDPLSGVFANVGANQLKHFEYVVEQMNVSKAAGANIKFEVVPFDSKGTPQETLTVLKSAIDKGIRYVTLGASGSGAALALIDAVNKHNEREPDKSVLFLNYGAVDPTLTNEKCSFWHFSFDGNVPMKVDALASHLAKEKSVKNVYLINQNYSAGQQASRYVKEMLPRKRQDLKIVGDDLHPLGQVKDFAPYVAKISASGADTVITQNWGNDLVLLIKAAKAANLKANFYTFYGDLVGSPAAFGAAGEGRVHNVSNWSRNSDRSTLEPIAAGFKAKYKEDFARASVYSTMAFLSAGVAKAKSVEPLAVAQAMEGLKIKGLLGEEEMRRNDHQLQQAIMVTTFAKADGKKVKHDVEGTGFGFAADSVMESYVASQPTSCQMGRPTK